MASIKDESTFKLNLVTGCDLDSNLDVVFPMVSPLFVRSMAQCIISKVTVRLTLYDTIQG